jgi:hypothetical protein
MRQTQKPGTQKQSQVANDAADGREGTPAMDRDTRGTQEDTPPPTAPTDTHFDVGSGNEETPDGLDAEAEATRRAAEERPLDPEKDDDVPVFDRGNRSELI